MVWYIFKFKILLNLYFCVYEVAVQLQFKMFITSNVLRLLKHNPFVVLNLNTCMKIISRWQIVYHLKNI